MAPTDPRHRRGSRRTRRWLAIALAIAVHAAFVGVLVFSMRWQNQPNEAVTAELYAPPVRQPVTEPAPPPKPAPAPAPKPEPEHKPPPKPEPERKPPPKPAPEPPKPDPRAAEIALKAKQEQERRKREEQEAAKKESERRVAEKREREREQVEKKKEEQRKLAEARERQTREAEAMREQADRERRELERERQAQAEAQLRAQAKAEAEARARDALSRAQSDYASRIQQKVRGNVILPPELAGNPEAIFDVVQLPTGEVLEATLRKSSGVRAYDEAVQRAILKSSPLPRPDRPELFQRVLTLKFRPRD